MKKLVALLVGLIIYSLSQVVVSAEEYEVKKGDTLWDIANEHKTSVKQLMDINGLDSSWIYPEQVLSLAEEEFEYYIVEQGDTLSKISEKHGDDVTIANLKAWNRLSSDFIITGQELVVTGAEDAAQTAEIQHKGSTNEVEDSESVVFNTESTEVNETETKGEPEEQDATIKGKTLSVEATAYTAYCAGCSGITATGINLKNNPNAKVIAVDPNVIPLGTKVYVEGYGHAIAGDTGGAIKGNKIDIHVPTKDEAFSWGRRVVEVTILE
ncbi:3D domain-containing protein [Oceanobacillus bengalensis]|uniref:LysM peptidoglycan-binding domain-containing protein n=1 Tax=Oceanobacillus bengalensis TaxID=1435466 RepID=A0A494Z546_9BACI|nr:3D domain-containing protein [Oceanobacillus bengalensis]RKQ17134.1 LysM peptidoglycan-binding domain-containing protein [Oceanobacillus bengalensis]